MKITDAKADASVQDVLAVHIKFNVRGTLRFLSHSESMRLFQRAFTRAGINVVHSRGFNPRPKLSLPLPRPVGVEADGELLTIRIEGEKDDFDEKEFLQKLTNQLPEAIVLVSAEVAETKKTFQTGKIAYILTVRPGSLKSKLKDKIEELLQSESLVVSRQVDAKGNRRDIDVRRFLSKIEIKAQEIEVECRISPEGTIRVDEIMTLLELGAEDLAGPVRRTSVRWQEKYKITGEQ